MPFRPDNNTLGLGSPFRNIAAVLIFVVTVALLSALGYRLAGWSWEDAFYMVTLTIFSVGYGEVHPINTDWLHFVTMATMVLGCTGMIVLTGVLVQAFTLIQLKQLFGMDRMKSQIDKLDGHIIICGLGRIGVMLAKDLADAKCAFVVIERDAAKCAEATAWGYLCLNGDATEESIMREAGVERARVLATVLPVDATNVFITLTARSMNKAVEIISRGEAPTTENKLIHAGANRVVLPTHIGAERIAEMILFPKTEDFIRETDSIRDLKRGMSEFGLEIEIVTAVAGGALTGMTVMDAEQSGGGSFFIVQIDRASGPKLMHPGPETLIQPDDAIVLVVRAGRATAGTKFSEPRRPMRVGRGTI